MRKITWKSAIAATAMVSLVALSACSSPSTSPDPSADGDIGSKTIGWVDVTLAGSYQERLHDVASEAIDHLGWELITVDTQGDPAKSASGVSSLVASNVDAIILSAITPSSARAGLLEAKQKGIPVIMVGSSVDDSLDEELDLTYIGEDEYALTAPLADLMLSQLGDGDKVGLVTTTALASAVQRTEAVTDALEAAGVEVVPPIETGFDFTAGQKTAGTLLNQHPDLDAIISIYDLWTAATVSAIKSSGRDVKVYSYYADAVNNPLMRDNPETVLGLADGDMINAPLLALDKLLAYFAAGTAIDASGSEAYDYVAIEKGTLPPGEQNGPLSPEDALAPYYEKWAADYGIAAD